MRVYLGDHSTLSRTLFLHFAQNSSTLRALIAEDPLPVVGRTIELNGEPFTVVGIAREGFASSQLEWAPDLFIPLSEQARVMGVPGESLGNSSLYITGRLAAGRTPSEARGKFWRSPERCPTTRSRCRARFGWSRHATSRPKCARRRLSSPGF